MDAQTANQPSSEEASPVNKGQYTLPVHLFVHHRPHQLFFSPIHDPTGLGFDVHKVALFSSSYL